jgi:hypothetical protein
VDCLGNLFVDYVGLVGVILVLLGFNRRGYFRAFLFALGDLASYLPFLLVPRTLFLYHYIIPLMFACACTGITLDFWTGSIVKGVMMVLLSALVIFGYAEWSPLVYGRPMTETEFESRVWNRVWYAGRAGREKWLASYDAKFQELRAQEIAYVERMKKLGHTLP